MQRLLDIENLRTTFDIHVGKVQAVRGVNLHVDEGETVGVVGESGCGKSVSMLSVLHLLPDYAKISADKMVFDGTDLTQLTPKMFRKISGDQIGMIFQDPMTSLNPIHPVGAQILEVLDLHYPDMDKAEKNRRVDEILRLVGIPPSRKNEFPHQFSGGMKQRIVIAMALIAEPELLIADEPTTALDVTIQAQILEMMKGLKEKFNTAVLMITHDLGVVAEFCDYVAVVYAGEVIEHGTVQEVFARTKNHPYTEGLFDCLPDLSSTAERLIPIPGFMADPTNLPEGCSFAERCRYATDVCRKQKPEMRFFGQHGIKCLRFAKEEV